MYYAATFLELVDGKTILGCKEPPRAEQKPKFGR